MANSPIITTSLGLPNESVILCCAVSEVTVCLDIDVTAKTIQVSSGHFSVLKFLF